MPVRRWTRTTRSALPRLNLTARTVTQQFLPNGYSSDEMVTFEEFTLKACTIQPASGEELETLGEGYKEVEAYNIFTATNANPAIEGTRSNPDEVFLDMGISSGELASDPGWFIVAQRKAWRNQVVPHYHLLVVRKNDQ